MSHTTAAAGEGQSAADYVRANYTKYEFGVPMRDGVRLMTHIYVPKNDQETYPILLNRTPYGLRPYGVDNQSREPSRIMGHYAREGFIFVFQDARGRNGSEGEFVQVRPHQQGKSGAEFDESSDTFDTIEWLIANAPQNNGNVGLTGVSYDGFYAVHGMVDSHPALRCVSPQAPMIDWFIGDDFHHNGVFYLASGFGFLAMIGQKLEKPTRQFPRPFDYETPDGYEYFLNLGPLRNIREVLGSNVGYWEDLEAHGHYDEYWKARTPLPHLEDVKPAVLTVGGWFDAEDLYGPLAVHRTLGAQSAGTDHHLVMGPWSHGGWHRGDGDALGPVRFHQKTSEWYRAQVELPWLNHHLKDGPAPALARATCFETGTNVWRRFESWPPVEAVATPFYLGEGGALSKGEPSAVEAFDEYVSDPAKPVPHVPHIAMGMTREYMVDDQRFAATRPDVLVYSTPPLEEDLTLAGPLTAQLWVSTTGTDSDWVVKLIDVYHGDFPNPDPNPAGLRMGGYQQLVRGEPFRGKFREGFDNPLPFEPGEPTFVQFELPDVFHTFRRGHRVMLHVQSSWFPIGDRNPQTFCDIYTCDERAFVKATQRVWRSREHASRIVLPVLRSGF
tara:strand:+ start:3038 stop:4876 length:1839 start_codon:yes stop_codon:yes gene_type:complete